jgi:hypothetical protein
VVAKGTEERSMWLESFTVGLVFNTLKMVIALGGVDLSAGPQVQLTTNNFALATLAMWRRFNVGDVYIKWRAGELMVQKKFPQLVPAGSHKPPPQAARGCGDESAPLIAK